MFDCFNEYCIPVNGVERPILTINQKVGSIKIVVNKELYAIFRKIRDLHVNFHKKSSLYWSLPTNDQNVIIFLLKKVCLGDTIVVDVHNAISSSFDTSIHWHGMLQRESLWMDGVPMLTQCSIHVGNVFRYNFLADDPGTHWFHSHTGNCFDSTTKYTIVCELLHLSDKGLQKADGLYGGLVVRSANDCNKNLYDYDLIDHTLILSDWTNLPASSYATGFRSAILTVNSLTVDGHGIYVNPMTKENTIAPMKVVYCQRDKRYRFRIVNAGNQNCPFEVDVSWS